MRRRHAQRISIGLAAVVLAIVAAFPVAGQSTESFPTAELGEAFPPVLSPGWVERNLHGPDLAILDARPSIRAYAEGHLPGARHLTSDNLRSSAEGVPGRVYPIEMIETIAGRLGLTQYARIVVYGEGSDPHAAFVATVLRAAGLQHVSILDGGLARWSAEGRPLSRSLEAVAPTRVRLTPTTRLFVGLQEVRQAVENGSALLLDCRRREAFESGHLPGAVHRFWKEDLAASETDGAASFRPVEELEEEYRALGVGPQHPTIVYCTSAHTAASVVWSLRYRLGYPETRLYDGSWLEWASHPELEREPPEGPPAGIPLQALQRAREAARSLGSSLMGALLRELKAGGPLHALGVCYEIAPSIAAEHSVEGMTVRRISNKVRNTADTPDAYERVALRDLQWRHDQGKLPEETIEVVRSEGRRVLRYLRPILVKEVCLQCHGRPERIDPAVGEFLRERYPEDQATGYEVGDLRGAVSVTIELDDGEE
ncbi:MAG: DUF3365 domain-containing protein [Candidatus Eisenbacteria bacterium]|nr:DUF3365 domain-containing protein [Candidatus Latescibacterota bacterium]MBD3301908.1 DUF3365 domain-containing protein [Candidatus Eisenbacteria bacterium]